MKSSTRDDWPFDEPHNVAVFTTAEIIANHKPILFVSHDADDGEWQLLTGDTVTEKDAKIVALFEIYDLDPTVGQLHELPLGWCAIRKDASSPWEVFKHA